MNKKEFGKIGEEVACRYLTKIGYKIIDRNFYFYGGEIDIIAFDADKNEIVFIEVKTRASSEYGHPSDAVDSKKIKRIKKGMKYYLYINKLEKKFTRVDVIELYYRNSKFYIHHIKQIL